MADIFPPKKRAAIMREIGPKNSQQELFIRKMIFALGFRFRLHRKNLPGTPDIVFPKYKKVIFVNGCFWHGHKGCKRSALPGTNRAFWEGKISSNMRRDKANYIFLNKAGWKYFVVWQCAIKREKINALKRKIIRFLGNTI
ncbi:MAG: DNA mismatch endonuclease Vsr [Thermodesulfovibrionales bacterium]|nr:DNA mismatch endonuclease Vsr [Thermodesulfovibrionales bacterium]